MKKVLAPIFGLTVLLSSATATAGDAIDTSAVTQLLILKESSPTLPAELLDEKLMALLVRETPQQLRHLTRLYWAWK